MIRFTGSPHNRAGAHAIPKAAVMIDSVALDNNWYISWSIVSLPQATWASTRRMGSGVATEDQDPDGYHCANTSLSRKRQLSTASCDGLGTLNFRTQPALGWGFIAKSHNYFIYYHHHHHSPWTDR